LTQNITDKKEISSIDLVEINVKICKKKKEALE